MNSGGHGGCLPLSPTTTGLRADSDRWTLLPFVPAHRPAFPPPLRGTNWNGAYLSEPGQTHCTAVDLSRQNSCPSMSIVSEPLHVEQVVNRPDRPPALQGLGPATPWWAELGPDQWSPWHWNGPWAFFRDFPYVKPMNHQVSHGLFFGCLYPRDGASGWTATIEGHGNTRSHPS